MRIRQFFLALMMAAVPIVALADNADDDNVVPEPVTLALLGIGAAALAISRASKRK